MSFKATIQPQGQDVLVVLEGMLDERARLPEFDSEIQGRLILDLHGLQLINSLGIRNWVIWTKKIRSKGGIVLRRCGTVVVNQLNILHGFLPANATVESFFVPYHCPQCDREELVFYPASAQVPSISPCPSCHSTMELDAIREKYLGFLKKAA